MSRPALILAVALASYAVFNIAFSIAVAAAWRLRFRSRVSTAAAHARTLVRLRLSPIVAALILTAALVVPAFVMFEPVRESEDTGPLLIVLALIAIGQLAGAAAIAAATSLRTHAAAQHWLRGGVPLDVDPPAGVPAYAIDSLAPIVALVGVFKPRLVAARCVIDACTAGELTAIVAHERGHLQARDNLKRWLMACAPDALRWTPLHYEIERAWHDAAEDAADDAATGSDAASRVDLAALLVKIARLAPAPAWRDATVSPFVEPGGLDRRVRRLLVETSTEPARPSYFLGAVAMVAIALAVSILAQPAAAERLYGAIEALVAFGR
jgi:Zn-dependent protease with chaperone function